MEEILSLTVLNLEKIYLGIGLFLCAYISNVLLGAYKNVKIEGCKFDWQKILQSGLKFIVLGVGLGLLTVSISIIPHYTSFVGIVIDPEIMETIDSLVIMGAFLTATIRYILDSLNKIKTILGS